MIKENFKSIASERDKDNIALLKRLAKEIWNKKRIEIINEIFSPNFICHYEYGDIKGINAWVEKHYNPLINAFPDIHVEVEDIISKGDYVVTRWKARAVHTGDLYSLPPTGEKIEFSGMAWSKIVGDKIIEHWVNWNMAYMVQQLSATLKTLSGLLPICSSCKKIRDDKGYWNQVERYILEHTDAELTHSICPECSKKLYPDLDID